MESLRSRPDDETKFLPQAPNSFQRGPCRVQNWIDIDNDNIDSFTPDPNRYYLFVNYGCGWCHQVLIVRKLRGLEKSIGITQVGMKRGNPEKRGTEEYLGYVIKDKRILQLVKSDNDINNKDSLKFEFPFDFNNMRDVYNQGLQPDSEEWKCNSQSMYGTDQLTIPVLLDKKTKKVVSNDPAQILLMFDYWADKLRGSDKLDNRNDSESDVNSQSQSQYLTSSLYPPNLQKEIEDINAIIYPGINNGVYCCWFGAKGSDCNTPAFQEGFDLVQNALQWMEEKLKGVQSQKDKVNQNKSQTQSQSYHYLCSTPDPTLADVRAFPHIFRFDVIYYELMLRNKGKKISESFPYIQEWLKNMFNYSQIYSTCDLHVATRFYFSSIPIEESDAIYERERARPGMEWLPTIENWRKKRESEGVTEEMIGI